LKDEVLAATCTINHNFVDLNMATINASLNILLTLAN
jgi:hypothetical protein